MPTAIVLAGGQSRRMGTNKAFLEVDKGRPLIERVIDGLKAVFEDILVVVNKEGPFAYLTGTCGARVITDIVPDKGPLAGLYTGLSASRSQYSFCLACDAPYINAALIRYMTEGMKGWDALVPRINERLHPLFAVYSKSCLSAIEDMLRRDEGCISALFSRIKTCFLSEEEMRKFDPDLLSLVNLNTPQDVIKFQDYCHAQTY